MTNVTGCRKLTGDMRDEKEKEKRERERERERRDKEVKLLEARGEPVLLGGGGGEEVNFKRNYITVTMIHTQVKCYMYLGNNSFFREGPKVSLSQRKDRRPSQLIINFRKTLNCFIHIQSL